MLSLKQVKDVCFINGGSDCCRYLDEEIDDLGNIIHLCKKLSPDQSIIDNEISDFLKESKKQGLDPFQQGVPLGNNCSGYVVLKTKLQGYDVV